MDSHSTPHPNTNALSPSTQPRNLVLIGSSGTGKSSLGNTLVARNVFAASDGMERSTEHTQTFFSPELNINIIDTYGFDDSDDSKQQTQLSAIFRYLKPSDLIHAFVLVAPCTPRASTLVADLHKFLNRFGTVAFRSLVLVFLDIESRNTPRELFEGQISKMAEVQARFEEAGVKFTSQRYLQWDNEQPRPSQREQLLQKITGVEPYDEYKFLFAIQQCKARQEKQIEQKINEQISRTKREHSTSLQQQEKLIAQMKHKQQQEKADLAKRLEQQNKALMDGLIEKMQIDKKEKEEMEVMIIQMKKANDQAMMKLAKAVGHDRELYQKKMLEMQRMQDQTNMQLIQAMKEMAAEQDRKRRRDQQSNYGQPQQYGQPQRQFNQPYVPPPSYGQPIGIPIRTIPQPMYPQYPQQVVIEEHVVRDQQGSPVSRWFKRRIKGLSMFLGLS